MSRSSGRWIPVQIGGRSYERLDLEHPDVGARVIEEIDAGVDVYYDRRWALTQRFCRFLVDHPVLVAGKRVLVAGAGVGMESVVVGDLARRVVVNDLAPVALELCREQLRHNDIAGVEVAPGPFQDVGLDGIDLVVACFVVYDEDTRRAMEILLERTAGRGVPVLLANEDIGGHFSSLVDSTDRPVQVLASGGKGRIVLVR